MTRLTLHNLFQLKVKEEHNYNKQKDINPNKQIIKKNFIKMTTYQLKAEKEAYFLRIYRSRKQKEP